MPISNAPRIAACVAALACLAQAASAAEILIADEKSQPESLTVAPGGVLIVGSAYVAVNLLADTVVDALSPARRALPR